MRLLLLVVVLFVVPENVSELQVYAWGAGGGGGSTNHHF